MGREEEKPPQVKTQGHKLPTDGSDHATRLKGYHSGQWYNFRPITPNIGPVRWFNSMTIS